MFRVNNKKTGNVLQVLILETTALRSDYGVLQCEVKRKHRLEEQAFDVEHLLVEQTFDR